MKAFRLILLLTLVVSIQIACNKNDKDSKEEDDTTEQQQHSKDEMYVSNESDANLDELNRVLSGNTMFGKTAIISGATIDDTTYASEKKMVITYNGLNAAGTRMRVGVVSIQLMVGDKWQDIGSVLKVTYTNLVITNQGSGNYITLNGHHLITNQTGGRAFVDTAVTHTIRGLMTVSFDGGASHNWSIARKRIMRHYDLVYTVEVRGDTSIGLLNNVVIWGTNRNGTSFHTVIKEPIIWSSLCMNGPLSGVKMHPGIFKGVTVTFGVDEQGNPVTGTCPYGIRIDWSTTIARTAVIGYL